MYFIFGQYKFIKIYIVLDSKWSKNQCDFWFGCHASPVVTKVVGIVFCVKKINSWKSQVLVVAVIAEMKEAERSIWKEDDANLIAKNRKATLKYL